MINHTELWLIAMKQEISSKSEQAKQRNFILTEIIKRALPRRYDRLHDNADILEAKFGPLLTFEFIYLTISLIVSTLLLARFS